MKYLILALLPLFFMTCQWTPTEPDNEPGGLEMTLSEIPNFVSRISGSLSQGDLTITFEASEDTTLFIENLSPGTWFLEINVYDSLDVLTHSGSRYFDVVSRQTVNITIVLSAVSGPEGGLILDVIFGDRDPILDYRFDGSANDYSIYENDATLFNTTYTTDRNGSSNRAIHFNGSTSMVVPNNSGVLKTSLPVTISMWVNIVDDNIDRGLFSNGGITLSIAKNDTAANGMDQGIDLVVSIGDAECRTVNDIASFSWCSIVVIIRGVNDIDIYTNQMLQDLEYTGSGTLEYTSDVVTIGDRFRGDIDDFRIYNIALSEDEAMELMQ